MVCPLADQVQVYWDQQSYHTALIQLSTGVIYVSQMLYNYVTKTYYVYLRCGESEYTLDEPFDTLEQAKLIFTTKYQEALGVTWGKCTVVTNSK